MITSYNKNFLGEPKTEIICENIQEPEGFKEEEYGKENKEEEKQSDAEKIKAFVDKVLILI